MVGFFALEAEIKVSAFLWGKTHQRTKDKIIIWNLTAESIVAPPDKRPEDSMLMHTHLVLLEQRGFKACAGLSCEM